jgi:hypothetical protein
MQSKPGRQTFHMPQYSGLHTASYTRRICEIQYLLSVRIDAERKKRVKDAHWQAPRQMARVSGRDVRLGDVEYRGQSCGGLSLDGQ